MSTKYSLHMAINFKRLEAMKSLIIIINLIIINTMVDFINLFIFIWIR